MRISSRLFAVILTAFAVSSPLSAQIARLVKDLNPGSSDPSPAFQELAGAAWILTRYPTTSLWRSNGTEAGTTLVFTEPAGTVPAPALIAAAGRLFWLESPTNPPPSYWPFWLMSSDGTAAGTGPVVFPPEFDQTSLLDLPVRAGRQVFIQGMVLAGRLAVARADGTAAGTRILAEFPALTRVSICAFHESAAWLVGTASAVQTLWISDGTPEGTRLVKTLSSRSPPYCRSAIRRLGRALVFVADDGANGCGVWVSDGTTSGTRPVGSLATSNAEIVPVASSRGVFLFTNGTDFWRTNGTESGTYLLKAGVHLKPMGVGTREGSYFALQGDGPLEQLWVTDGTPSGTALLHDFSGPSLTSMALDLQKANGRLLATYWETNPPGSFTGWTSDGTPAGTSGPFPNLPVSGPGLPYRGTTLFAGGGSSGPGLYAVDAPGFSAPVVPTSFSLVAPCRLIDTRLASGFLGGPVVTAGEPRVFPVGDACGIPSAARAIAANVTVAGATADGLLKIHPSDIGEPETSVINFKAGQTRANNATIALSGDGETTVRYETATGTGAVHLIVDVVGWYE